MENDIENKVATQYSDDVIDYLVEESFKLLLKLKKYNNLSVEDRQKMMSHLKKLYIEDDKSYTIYTAYYNQLLVGCACIDDTYNLRDLFVRDGFHKLGIGSLLINELLKNLNTEKSIYVTTHKDAVDFYINNGFQIIDEQSDNVKLGRNI